MLCCSLVGSWLVDPLFDGVGLTPLPLLLSSPAESKSDYNVNAGHKRGGLITVDIKNLGGNFSSIN